MAVISAPSKSVIGLKIHIYPTVTSA
jgi:hypothetical protein